MSSIESDRIKSNFELFLRLILELAFDVRMLGLLTGLVLDFSWSGWEVGGMVAGTGCGSLFSGGFICIAQKSCSECSQPLGHKPGFHAFSCPRGFAQEGEAGLDAGIVTEAADGNSLGHRFPTVARDEFVENRFQGHAVEGIAVLR
jgi:hypothetical protein